MDHTELVVLIPHPVPHARDARSACRAHHSEAEPLPMKLEQDDLALLIHSFTLGGDYDLVAK
jgi:hypothetical protein